FFPHPPTTERYTLSLHDALPILIGMRQDGGPDDRLVQRDRGVVLADLVFVPDDRHLGLPLLVQNQRPAKPVGLDPHRQLQLVGRDRKSTRLNSSHVSISYAVFCL